MLVVVCALIEKIYGVFLPFLFLIFFYDWIRFVITFEFNAFKFRKDKNQDYPVKINWDVFKRMCIIRSSSKEYFIFLRPLLGFQYGTVYL